MYSTCLIVWMSESSRIVAAPNLSLDFQELSKTNLRIIREPTEYRTQPLKKKKKRATPISRFLKKVQRCQSYPFR